MEKARSRAFLVFDDIARLGLRAAIGGTLVNLMSAALAGLLFSLQ